MDYVVNDLGAPSWRKPVGALAIVALTALLEPLTIVIMGSMVGFIAMAILMPLIQMNQLVD